MTARTALVVDDSRAIRLILGEMLHQLGFQVREAADGSRALDLLRADPEPLPALALVDWNMPVMNGLELIQALRADRGYDQVKLLVITSESDMANIDVAMAAGADEFMMKPFSPEAFNSKLAMIGVLAE